MKSMLPVYIYIYITNCLAMWNHSFKIKRIIKVGKKIPIFEGYQDLVLSTATLLWVLTQSTVCVHYKPTTSP